MHVSRVTTTGGFYRMKAQLRAVSDVDWAEITMAIETKSRHELTTEAQGRSLSHVRALTLFPF